MALTKIPASFIDTSSGISGDMTFSGNLTLTGYLAGPATFTIDPSAVGDNTGTVVIAGNLQVDGTTTTINSTTMTVDDLNIVLASGAANAAAADGAGITIDGASATLTYSSSADGFVFNKDIDVTGTVTADGLTVDGVANFNANNINYTGSSPKINFFENDATDQNTSLVNTVGDFIVRTVNDASTSTTDRIRLDHATGDISFYEDTGTTPKFFWDASAESLGIGTTSPATLLHLNEASTNEAAITLSNTDGSYKISANNDFAIHFADTFKFANQADTTEYMRIDSSGNVGIGNTGNTSRKLDVTQESGQVAGVRVRNSGSGAYYQMFSGTANPKIGTSASTDQIEFHTDGTGEVMRITSNGEFLIGKTSTDSGATAGIEIRQSGLTYIARSGTPFVLNRIGSDGDEIVFLKDGANVGSIGNAGSDLYIASGQAGLRFRGGLTQDRIVPTNSSGSGLDGTVDLGDAGTRFENLFLSGGVYLGGTGAANHLDDYEEGTFTCTIVDDTSGNTLSYSDTTAKYTKVGDIVYIEIHAPYFQNSSSTGAVKITSSAPFASAKPAILFAGGPMRGFDATTRDSNPVVAIAGATRNDGGSGMYTLLANEGSNINGYDAMGGAWNRNSGFNAPGLFIQGSYKIN